MQRESEEAPLAQAVEDQRVSTPLDLSEVNLSGDDNSIPNRNVPPAKTEYNFGIELQEETATSSGNEVNFVSTNDEGRPSTSRGVHNESNGVNRNNEAPGVRSAIDDVSERIFEGFVRELRAREFKKALFQRERSPFIEYLFSIEPEID